MYQSSLWRKARRCQRGNQNLQIEEGQTTQWPNGLKEKQRSTKHYTET